MNFDTAHRHQQALDPSALTTIRTTLHAIEQGIIDCRNAGVDPDTDPAVVLLARHLAIVSSNRASDAVLGAACRHRLDEIRRFPALRGAARPGAGAVSARQPDLSSATSSRITRSGPSAPIGLRHGRRPGPSHG